MNIEPNVFIAPGHEDRRVLIGEGHRGLGAELVGVRVRVVRDQPAGGLPVEPLAHQPRVAAGRFGQRIGGPGPGARQLAVEAELVAQPDAVADGRPGHVADHPSHEGFEFC